MATVRLEAVCKRYGEVEAVRDLALLCPDGEMMALLGPSGCGKSSTLKMIAGIEPISRGEIFFDEKPVSELAPHERNIAMVFEDYALYPHLSVFENIAFPLKLRKLPPKDIKQRVDATIDLLGLTALGKQDVRNLSGGAQQRISIGRALVRDPELILFDEPLSHLDGNQRVMLRSEIKRLQQSVGLTAILVTHDQTEAMAMANHVAVMRAGVLQQVDSPQALYEHPANLFVANFIGEPPMNLLDARFTASSDTLRFGNGDSDGKSTLQLSASLAKRLASRANGAEFVVGIRPEHVELAAEADPLAGRVVYREPRGDVDVLVVDTNATTSGRAGSRITVEAAGGKAPRRNERISLRFPDSKLHFFNADTGHNLLLDL